MTRSGWPVFQMVQNCIVTVKTRNYPAIHLDCCSSSIYICISLSFRDILNKIPFCVSPAPLDKDNSTIRAAEWDENNNNGQGRYSLMIFDKACHFKSQTEPRTLYIPCCMAWHFGSKEPSWVLFAAKVSGFTEVEFLNRKLVPKTAQFFKTPCR